jgi:hypothetical protein
VERLCYEGPEGPLSPIIEAKAMPVIAIEKTGEAAAVLGRAVQECASIEKTT